MNEYVCHTSISLLRFAAEEIFPFIFHLKAIIPKKERNKGGKKNNKIAGDNERTNKHKLKKKKAKENKTSHSMPLVALYIRYSCCNFPSEAAHLLYRCHSCPLPPTLCGLETLQMGNLHE